MRLVSWNVNGLRAVLKKNFIDYFDSINADIFCLQEIKLSEGQLELELSGYDQFYNYAAKKGYSGTAVFTRLKPLNTTYNIGIESHSFEGRAIVQEYDKFYLVTCYTPNAQDGLKRIEYRLEWDSDFREYLKKLDGKKPLIVCGDFNVANENIDIHDPVGLRGNPGFSDQERESFKALLSAGFTDSFRYMHPDLKEVYSWWSYRTRARSRNAGWRIDYFLVSDRLSGNIVNAGVEMNVEGSDHCPVLLDIEL